MTEKQFDLIIKRLIYNGTAYIAEISILEDWCQKKYNCNWSDLDCDDIIDSLEFGAGKLTPMTFKEFKESIESRL